MAEIFLADLADFAGMNVVWDAWVVPGCIFQPIVDGVSG
jgi:hypothetical protein